MKWCETELSHYVYAGAQPVQIFTKSNMTSSPVITYSLPKDDDVNEVVVNFTSPETYKTETVYCHIDEEGNKRITYYPESDNQERLDAWGVTDREHAMALGMRRLRYLRNTRVTYDIKTELNGLNCNFNDLVGLVLDENLSNITGRIIAINGLTITTDIEIPEDCWDGVVYTVTIECASDLTEPYTMNDKVYAALVDLCVDICRRNDKKKLVWIADRDKALNYAVKPDEMLLTVHRWFARKSYSGNWLFGKLGDLAQEVNSRLGE